MDVLWKIASSNLRKNKKRSIVTALGIALSIALLAAICIMVTTVEESFRDMYRQGGCDWHVEFYGEDLTDDEVERIKSSSDVESYFCMQYLGLYDDESDNYYSGYELHGADEESFSASGLDIIEGRYPANSSEVAVEYKEIGEELTLSYVNEDGTAEEKTFTVVGKLGYVGISLFDENMSYFMVTVPQRDVPVNYYVKLKDDFVRNCINFANSITDSYKTSELLDISGDSFVNDMAVFLTVAVIIAFVVVLISQYCIRNSFDISVNECIRQLAMLRSVGATSRQIKRSVYLEAFILGLVAFVPGFLIGIGFSKVMFYFFDKVAYLLNSDSFNMGIASMQLNIIFTVSWKTVLFTFVLSFVMVMWSAMHAARRAAKVNPIETIRQKVPVTKKKVGARVPSFVRKIFGEGGVLAWKNSVRNKTLYRTVEVSIALCVALFIIAGFVKSLFINMLENELLYTWNVNYVAYDKDSEDYADLQDVLDNIKDVEHKGDMAIVSSMVATCDLKYTDKYLDLETEYTGFSDEGEIYTSSEEDPIIWVYRVGDDEYQRILESNGIDPQEASDGAVIVNSGVLYLGFNNVHVPNYFDVKTGDEIEFNIKGVDNTHDLKVTGVIHESPVGVDKTSGPVMILSDEMYARVCEEDGLNNDMIDIYFDSNSPYELEQDLYEVGKRADYSAYIFNMQIEQDILSVMETGAQVLLNAFIGIVALIGITNMFNTVNANMLSRRREFAALRSIGMTDREFSRMMALEGIFYAGKAYLQALLIGVFFVLAITWAMNYYEYMPLEIPWKEIIISFVAVSVITVAITIVTMRDSAKQNIIENLRNETF